MKYSDMEEKLRRFIARKGAMYQDPLIQEELLEKFLPILELTIQDNPGQTDEWYITTAHASLGVRGFQSLQDDVLSEWRKQTAYWVKTYLIEILCSFHLFISISLGIVYFIFLDFVMESDWTNNLKETIIYASFAVVIAAFFYWIWMDKAVKREIKSLNPAWESSALLQQIFNLAFDSMVWFSPFNTIYILFLMHCTDVEKLTGPNNSSKHIVYLILMAVLIAYTYIQIILKRKIAVRLTEYLSQKAVK